VAEGDEQCEWREWGCSLMVWRECNNNVPRDSLALVGLGSRELGGNVSQETYKYDALLGSILQKCRLLVIVWSNRLTNYSR